MLPTWKETSSQSMCNLKKIAPRLVRISPAFAKQHKVVCSVMFASEPGKGDEMDFTCSNRWQNLYFSLM